MRCRYMYDLLSRFYWVVGAFDDRYKRMAIDAACLRGDERVLDSGCGVGYLLAKIRQDGHAGGLFGIDFSEGMILRARRSSGSVVAVGDSLEMPFANGSFDVVFSSFVFDLFDKEGQVRIRDEISRVLVDGGLVVLVNNARGSGVFYALSGFYMLLRRVFPYVLLDRPVDTRRVFLEDGRFEMVNVRVIGFTEIAIYRMLN